MKNVRAFDKPLAIIQMTSKIYLFKNSTLGLKIKLPLPFSFLFLSLSFSPPWRQRLGCNFTQGVQQIPEPLTNLKKIRGTNGWILYFPFLMALVSLTWYQLHEEEWGWAPLVHSLLCLLPHIRGQPPAARSSTSKEGQVAPWHSVCFVCRRVQLQSLAFPQKFLVKNSRELTDSA